MLGGWCLFVNQPNTEMRSIHTYTHTHRFSVPGFVYKAKFAGHFPRPLFNDGFQVQALVQNCQHAQKHVQRADVHVQQLGDAAVLDFDGHLRAVCQPAAMNLSDGRRGDGHVFQLRKQLFNGLLQVFDDGFFHVVRGLRAGTGLQLGEHVHQRRRHNVRAGGQVLPQLDEQTLGAEAVVPDTNAVAGGPNG